jgi:hypothetical protein
MLSQEVHLLCDLQVFTSFSRKTNNEIKSQNHHKELPHVEMHWLAYVQSSIFCRHAFYIVFFAGGTTHTHIEHSTTSLLQKNAQPQN